MRGDALAISEEVAPAGVQAGELDFVAHTLVEIGEMFLVLAEMLEGGESSLAFWREVSRSASVGP